MVDQYWKYDEWAAKAQTAGYIILSSEGGMFPTNNQLASMTNVGVGLNRFATNRANLNAAGGTMWGSPYSPEQTVTSDSTILGLMKHAVESLAVSDQDRPNTFLMDFSAWGTQGSFPSVTRNGLASFAYGPYSGARVSAVYYWDYNLNAARRFDATTLTWSTVNISS